jgi:hypothetical protein
MGQPVSARSGTHEAAEIQALLLDVPDQKRLFAANSAEVLHALDFLHQSVPGFAYSIVAVPKVDPMQPVWIRHNGEWFPVHYVGPIRDGTKAVVDTCATIEVVDWADLSVEPMGDATA